MKNRFAVAAFACIITGLLLIASAAYAQQDPAGFTIPLSDPAKRGKLKAHLNYGSITVKGTARKDVLVKYKPEKNEDHDEDRDDEHDEDRDNERSKSGLKKVGGGGLNLEASENGNLVRIGSDSWNNRLGLEIEVPADFDLDVSTYNDGDIIITNVQGALEITNYNGAITALNISGSVVATTYNGDIKVTFDKVKEATPMSYSTYNGDIDLTFPATLKASLKMKTEQGDIYTGFDANIVGSGPEQRKDAKSGSFKLIIDEWKRGDIGGGGPEFTMKNYNGDIYIRKK